MRGVAPAEVTLQCLLSWYDLTGAMQLRGRQPTDCDLYNTVNSMSVSSSIKSCSESYHSTFCKHSTSNHQSTTSPNEADFKCQPAGIPPKSESLSLHQLGFVRHLIASRQSARTVLRSEILRHVIQLLRRCPSFLPAAKLTIGPTTRLLGRAGALLLRGSRPCAWHTLQWPTFNHRRQQLHE